MLRILLVLLAIFYGLNGYCEVTVHAIFGDKMVLQRDTVNKLWGWADAEEKITITIGEKTINTEASDDGKWSALLPPFPAGGPYTITIQGKNKITFENILFGEVWLCSGQSNMQYTLGMLGKDISKIDRVGNPMIRQFRNELDVDYLPKADLKGGYWVEADSATVLDFSATAYYFGRVLYDSLKVPIGLLNINLGATTIETWMSGEALQPFPQFRDIIEEIHGRGKNFDDMYADLESFRKSWDNKHYMKGPGFDEKWYLPQYDDSKWSTMKVPNFWEYEGLDHDGAVWFRRKFDLPEGFAADSFQLALNQIDDYDITWVNGVKVGETFGNRNFRNYKVPRSLLKQKGNTLVVRVFDVGGLGGFHTAAFWGNPILVGEWKYKAGLPIDTTSFPVPDVPNGSIFSYPTLLYNGNIAPITDLSIKGVIWYQGESNAARAEEYRKLLPGLISDWRQQWDYDLPFLVVQLANHRQEKEHPGHSEWAELREAQSMALENGATHLAVTIDIGEADDIHPKNKEDVGYRLALGALQKCYGFDIVANSPVFKAMNIEGEEVLIEFDHIGSGLKTVDKYGYIRGFELAGEDRVFHWARAKLIGNKVVVWSDEVAKPVAVRYAWSDNPGELDLYNQEGLPLTPFRTDDWPLSTKGKVYDHTPHQF